MFLIFTCDMDQRCSILCSQSGYKFGQSQLFLINPFPTGAFRVKLPLQAAEFNIQILNIRTWQRSGIKTSLLIFSHFKQV